MNTIHKITRPQLESYALYGFVLGRSEQLTLLAEEDDFLLDGFKVIRNLDIAENKETPSTRHCSRIMRKEALLDGLEPVPDVDLAAWKTVLRCLKRQKKFVIVEDESRDIFLIGQIRRVNERSVTIKCFDGVGKWQDEVRIVYDDITCVSFGKRYIETHRRHLKQG